MDRARIAQWIQESSRSAPNLNVSSDSYSGSAVLDSRSRTTTPRLHTRNRENSLSKDENNDFATLASKGQLALEIGLNRLSHQTEMAWSVVSDGWKSILTSGNHTPMHKSASCPNIDQQKAAMLFAQYEKSRMSRMKLTAPGHDASNGILSK
jgi:hypothetical protein